MARPSYNAPRTTRNRTPKNPSIQPSRETAVAAMFTAGLNHLHRPNDPNDEYHTEESVRAWAERTTDDYIVRGLIVISPAVAK